MLKITQSSDLTPRLGINDIEVVGGVGKANDKNSSKKSKNVKSEI